ncbi:ribonuclease P protein subunit [Candidatus Woesearchaeota archaeon]|nr:ribonuclease P protein subunit [Candidatus Woesearchaeota archaeon]
MLIKNITKTELIGLPFDIVSARNPSLVGMHGTIVDETRYTFLIQKNNKNKRVMKEGITFRTALDNRILEIRGSVLVGRPEERIKSRVKK